MNATLNQYVADNWPRIRSELALEGVSDNLDIPVPTGTKVGKGFKGVEDATTGVTRAVPLDATHYNIRLRLLDGTPPQVVVLTAFPGNTNP